MTATAYEVKVSQAATPVLTLATEPVPGLHVYHQPDELHSPGDDSHPWRLGHHSGYAMAAFASQDAATQAAQLIANFADWTRTADDLRADPAFDLTGYYDRLMEHTDGLLIARTA